MASFICHLKLKWRAQNKSGDKGKVGATKFFRAEIRAPSLSIGFLPMNLPRLWDCDIDVLVWQNVF